MTVKEKYFFANPALQNARIQDVIAKTAHVTLKDTIRVLKALDLIAEFTNDGADYIVGCDMDPAKPSPEQASACMTAFQLIETVQGEEAVAAIRKFS